ncbi:hypothetical protein D7V82_17440 [bacterium 1xD8-6]|nr:hypothetical protein D7V72_05235 [bacterium D16-36]RKI64944.1 hypothetical protein D7V82_17440 [bacterium 1xD8-6]
MKKTEWIYCPVCGSKTRDRIRKDTFSKNYPLYCPKCKQETFIEVKNININLSGLFQPMPALFLLSSVCLCSHIYSLGLWGYHLHYCQ